MTNRYAGITRAVVLLACALMVWPAAPASAVGTREMERELDRIAGDVDAFWEDVAADLGLPYYPPGVDFQVGEFETGCAGEGEYAVYCPRDEVIYLDPLLLGLEVDRTDGTGIAIATVSHEWGHHLTYLWLDGAATRVDYGWLVGRDERMELLADCLSGVYLGHAWGTDPPDGQLISVVRDQSSIGSVVHGTGDERVVAFMSGYVEGLDGCDFLD